MVNRDGESAFTFTSLTPRGLALLCGEVNQQTRPRFTLSTWTRGSPAHIYMQSLPPQPLHLLLLPKLRHLIIKVGTKSF